MKNMPIRLEPSLHDEKIEMTQAKKLAEKRRLYEQERSFRYVRIDSKTFVMKEVKL